MKKLGILAFFFIVTLLLVFHCTNKLIYLLRVLFIPDVFRNKKVILLYTTLNLEPYWHGAEESNLKNHFERCPAKHCLITYDRGRLSKASAVLFHGQDMASDEAYSPSSLSELQRNAKQYWVWVNQESPANIRVNKNYNNIFNWTATYHRKSDIFLPYFFYRRAQRDRNSNNRQLQHLLKGKTKLVAWMVSDCGGLRQDYVLELQKHVDVTVYGACSKNYKQQGGHCIKHTKECKKEIRRYKFYLAFENSICEDYITEKYWENALMNNVVPIVMGSNYDATVAVPGSYIDAANFKSVKSLASYIMFLDKNDNEYLKYFDWMTKFEVFEGRGLFCSICEKLHKERTQKIYSHLDKFWNEEKYCSSKKMSLIRSQIIERKKESFERGKG